MTGSIHDLSNEIILQILRELATPGWPIETLVNSTLVCRRFHDLAQPPLFRKLTIPLGIGLPRWTRRLFKYLQTPAGEHVIHSVKHIDITAGTQSFCTDDLCLEFMAMLPQFSKLRTIRIMPYSILSHLTPSSGGYEGVRYVPSALLAAISDLYPRVDIDLELCGLVHDCRRVLKNCPNIRALDFTGLPRHYIPGTQEVAFVKKQPSLTKLSVALQSLRSFFPPQSDAGFQPMCLEELHLDNHETPHQPSPNKGLSLCHFVDLDTLRVLRLQGHKLIVSVLDELNNSTHKLESVSIDGGKQPPPKSPYYDLILRFFTSARLRKITIQSLGPWVPWLYCISNSGSGLLQLTIHATDRYWRQITSKTKAENRLGTNLKFGVTQKELWRLVTICPNIQRLGIDIPRVELVVELHTLLQPLLQLHHLRHLYLLSHPILTPYQPDQPLSERTFPRAIVITEQGRTKTYSSKSPSNALKLVSTLELVELLHYLRDQKKGVALETLMYRQGCDDDDLEECMLWYMGGRRVLVSYRYYLDRRHVQVPTEPVEVRELYDGTQLLWTQKRKLERETVFDEWTFPS